jgi:hypothetical protein
VPIQASSYFQMAPLSLSRIFEVRGALNTHFNISPLFFQNTRLNPEFCDTPCVGCCHLKIKRFCNLILRRRIFCAVSKGEALLQALIGCNYSLRLLIRPANCIALVRMMMQRNVITHLLCTKIRMLRINFITNRRSVNCISLSSVVSDRLLFGSRNRKLWNAHL